MRPTSSIGACRDDDPVHRSRSCLREQRGGLWDQTADDAPDDLVGQDG